MQAMQKQSQTLISDFFKPKPATVSKPKPKLLITDYFKPEPKACKKARLFKYNPKDHYSKSRRYMNNNRGQYDACSARKGYFYCATNNFTEYQVYLIGDHLLTVNDKKALVPMGTLVAEATVDDDSALEHISVESTFRRQGIGRNLIRFINKHDTQFHVYAGTEENSRYRLTEEGAVLIRDCEKRGILKTEQVILNYVPPSPSTFGF